MSKNIQLPAQYKPKGVCNVLAQPWPNSYQSLMDEISPFLSTCLVIPAIIATQLCKGKRKKGLKTETRSFGLNAFSG